MKNLFRTIFLASTIILSTCASPPTPTPPARTDVPAAPQMNFLSAGGVVASAEVVPLHDSEMSFAISAPVNEVLVNEGELVKAGQILMTLFAPELELSVTSAELGLKAAELDLVYWMPRYDRPPERRQQAQAETEEARARLKTAQANFSQTSLVAPFDATVVDIQIQAGEFAQKSRTALILGDLANLQIQTTDLSERDIPRVQLGQSVNVYVEALHTNVNGKVIRISPFSETVGGDVVFPVTIEFDDEPEGLLWGMTVEVEIQTSE